MEIPKKHVNKARLTNEDIYALAQVFDILLEGAIQSHQISENGKTAVTNNKSGASND